jgi:hypothetical protein
MLYNAKSVPVFRAIKACFFATFTPMPEKKYQPKNLKNGPVFY